MRYRWRCEIDSVISEAPSSEIAKCVDDINRDLRYSEHYTAFFAK